MAIVFDENATVYELSAVVVFFAVLWYLVFYAIKTNLKPIVHGKPWLRRALERDYERAGNKKLCEDLKIDMTKEEFVEWQMNDWPRMQCIYVQHFIGSLFCLPSILKLCDERTASSLAICGVLSEMGWELQDLAEMFLVRALSPRGRLVWPDSIVTLFVVHHSLSTLLGLPMVLYYRDSAALHWICFDLQFAAAFALAVGEYTKVLDTREAGSLRRFKVLNGLALAVMVWTRIVHWGMLSFELFVTWYRDAAWGFLCAGLFLSAVFSFFSWECCVKPYYKKFTKFLHVSAEYEHATPDRKRLSLVLLDDAVAELLANDGMDELARKAERLFEKRKPDRRRSMMTMRKRNSLVFARRMSDADAKGSSIGGDRVKQL